ncbi:MAG: ABC-2 type transport system permease protein [Planctomycetota bacterium]|jgi:ABC-2 type transport system permease protein
MERSLRAYFLPALAYYILLQVMLTAALLYWPNFEENVGALKVLAPIDMLKDMVDTLAQGGIEAYVVGQHFFKGCNTLGTAAAVMFSAGAVAGEVHRGTFEIWIARPFSRRRLLLERWIAGAIALTLPVFLTTLTVPWLLTFVDAEVSAAPLMLCAIHQSLFLLFCYSLTFFLSTVFDSPMAIALAVLFFTTLEFSIYLIKVITHWSLYRWVDIEVFMKIIKRGELDGSLVSLMIGLTGLLLGASLFTFSRKVP